MNKLFTKIAALALGAAMVVGVGVAVGSKSVVGDAKAGTNTIEITLASTQITSTQYSTSEKTWSQNDITFGYKKLIKGKPQGSSTDGLQTNGGTIYNKTAIPGSIRSVTFTQNGGSSRSWTLYLGTTAQPSTSYGNTGTNWTGITGSNNYFKLQCPGNAYYFTKLAITYEEAPSGKSVTTTTSGLTISPTSVANTGGTVTLTTASKKKLTNISVTGASYTLNGNEMTFTNVTSNITVNGTISNASVTSIAVSGQKTDFSLSDDFSFGGVVTGTYDDFVSPHTSEALESGYSVNSTAFKKGVAGNYTIIVSYNGAPNFEYSVSVSDITYYTKVNSISDLVDGAEIILVTNATTTSVSKRYAMTRTISSSLNGFAEVSVSNDTILRNATTTAYAYTLSENNNDWDIFNEATSKYLISSANKKMSESTTATCHWSISISSGVATISSTQNSDVGKIMFNWNNGSARFTTYTSSASASMILPSIYQYVNPSSKTKITMAAEGFSMNVGDADVAPVITNADTGETISGCTFESETTSVATIVNGKVHAVALGTSKITASHEEDEDYEYRNVEFTVKVIQMISIQSIYSLADNTEIEFDGYYAGEYADGIVVMDGAYGILVYKATSDNYVVDETVLHVSAEKTTYSNLVETKQGANVTVQTNPSAIAKLSLPTNHTLTGSESTADTTVANRRTFVAGTLKDITASSGNYNIVITVGETDLALYLKSADNKTITYHDAQDQEQTSSISNYLENVIKEGNYCIVKGFTSFHTNGFQVRVYDIVEVDNSFTVAVFSQMILDETDNVCEDWDGHTNNKQALIAVWNDLGGADGWQKLSPTEKTKFQDMNTYTPNYDNDSESVVENALGRYNYLCKKYSLTNFALRGDVDQAPVTPVGKIVSPFITEQSAGTVAIIIVSVIGVSALGGFFFLRKRKEI